MSESKDGLVTLQSSRGAAATLDRLSEMLRAKGVHIFARIDHAAGAHEVGMTLRPTEVLIFGNPQAGTPLMSSRQTIGIDLPLKALAWEDESGKTWLTYNDPAYLAARHAVADRAQAVAGLSALLQTLATAATAP